MHVVRMTMESIGQYLRKERELRQVSLEELAQTTRIPMKMLVRLEDDRYDELPGEVFVRGFIKSYARSLGLESAPLLERYGEARPVDDAPAPITAITPPERGRRFGIAFAMVILLVLFTLALSIVLRPRHRDQPIELSLAPSSWTEDAAAPSMPSCSEWSTTASRIASSPS
jgi:cytoskeletal protein RodZ